MLLFSCNNPDGKVYPTDPVATGWDKGVQTYSEYVIIQPTWGQSFYYHNKSGGGWTIIVGIILIIASAVQFYFLSKNLIKVTLLNILAFVLLFIGGLAFIFSGPGGIKGDDGIRIEKSYYDSHKDNLKALWDELYVQKRIVGTSGQ